MRWIGRLVAAVVLCLALPSQAFACYMPKFLTRYNIPGKMGYSADLGLYPGDELGLVLSGAVNIPFGSGKGGVSPMVGYCKFGDSGELLFGAAVGWEIMKSAEASANLQSGLSYQSFDGGSDLIIPFGASYAKKMSEMMMWFVGAQMLIDMYESSAFGQDYSETDSDPAIYGGVTKSQGAMSYTAALALKFGYDKDFAVAVGASTTGAANAIRRIGSTIFRK